MSQRNSAIELLKIAAILLIVLNHVIQSLTEVNPWFPDTSYLLDINTQTTNIVNLLLAIMRSSGCIGNDIFVVCSAWFLIDSQKSDKRKVVFLILDIWAVSVLIFVTTYALGCDLDRDTSLKQFFPTANASNWFLTCYILFFLLHPLLNKLIDQLNQRALLAVTSLLVLLYSICQYFRPWFFEGNLFYGTDLVVWIMIYFIVAYMKLYLKDLSSNIRANVIALVAGILGQALMIVLIDIAGLHVSFLQGRLLYFNYGGSPFIILLAVSALNLARRSNLKSRFINYISGLSLLIYIIHENIILRTVYRPWIFVYIHERFGYDHILLWLFAVTICIFLAAAITASIYSATIERLVRWISYKIYAIIKKLWLKIERALLRLH